MLARIFGLAWNTGAQGIEDIENVEIEDYIEGPRTSFTYTFTDDDGQGSGGWYIKIREYGMLMEMEKPMLRERDVYHYRFKWKRRHGRG